MTIVLAALAQTRSRRSLNSKVRRGPTEYLDHQSRVNLWETDALKFLGGKKQFNRIIQEWGIIIIMMIENDE